MATNSILAKMSVLIEGQTADFQKKLNQSENALTKFTGNITKLAGAVGVAFGVKEVAQFAFEVSKLAGEANGVRAAFEKLPESEELMNRLKTATAGTVSELDLMKRSVQAANFGISLEALPQLLEFAAIRAQQTGQSVDYLVDSIITGIGRKSPLILDNLGISAVRLKEQFGGAALEAQNIGDVAEAVGRIATEELGKMGDFSENTATKVERLNASWENFKVALGTAANESKILGAVLDILNESLEDLQDQLTPDKIPTRLDVIKDKYVETAKTQDQIRISIDKLTKLLKIEEKAYSDATGKLGDYNSQLSLSSDEFNKLIADQSTAKEFTDSYRQAIELLTAKLKELNTTQSVQVPLIQQINDKIKQFEELKNNAFTVDQIARFNAEIERLRGELDVLNAARPLSAFGRQQLGNAQSGVQTNVPDLSSTPGAFPSTAPEPDEFQPKFDALITAYQSSQQAAADWATATNIAQDQVIAKQQQAADAAVQYGQAIGDSLGAALSGQQSFADAMRKITADIIKMFLQRALAGIIASGATSGGPTPVALALAAAGVAAISAMFSKIGAPGGGGGGGNAGSVARNVNTPKTQVSNAAQDVKVIVEGIIHGQDIYIVGKNYERNNRYTSAQGG